METPYRQHAGGRWPVLTARHREILLLIMRGLTSREIGEHLGISRRTVEVHRTNIMRRLGARNVGDLFREAIVRRLVPKRYWSKGPGRPMDTDPPSEQTQESDSTDALVTG
jgi:DNA-binding CsgD family transcriptional regulator